MSELKDLAAAVSQEVATEAAKESLVDSVWGSVKDTSIGLVEEYPLVAAGAAVVGIAGSAWWLVKKLRGGKK